MEPTADLSWNPGLFDDENPYSPLGDSIEGFYSSNAMEQHNAAPAPEAPPRLAPAPQPLVESMTPEQLSGVIDAQSIQLERLMEQQQQVANAEDAQLGMQLLQMYAQMCTQLTAQIVSCKALRQDSVLEAAKLGLQARCLRELQRQRMQVELLEEELKQLMGMAASRPLARLFISEQPFPCAITKSKPAKEGRLVVRLLTGCVQPYKVLGEVEAVLKSEKVSKGKKGPLSSHTGRLHGGQVDLSDIRFETGSRRQSVSCKFRVTLQLGEEQGVIESDNSMPLVVITNESQWEGSEGQLLQEVIFAGVQTISWAYFRNSLQDHFLRCTRQDPERPERPLSDNDFELFRAKVADATTGTVSKRSFAAFWSWYGASLQVLRYQRHIGPLYTAGLIYGFMSRQDVQRALHDQPPGTFCVRFSERHHGSFAIAYVGQGMPASIKHYLVQPTDTLSAKKSLPDFLGECHQFQFILQLGKDVHGNPSLQRFPKDTLLEEFYSKRNHVDPGPGYDPLVQLGQAFGEM